MQLPTYQACTSTELLGRETLVRMMAKLSTRRYGAGLEPVGVAVEAASRSTSKSAVSRRFVAATETALGELMAADLSQLDLVAIMIDGVHFAGLSVRGGAWASTSTATSAPSPLEEGDTENATLVKDLLAGLRERGLDMTKPILAVLDGAKALCAGVKAVFDHPVIARCQLHKIRNVESKLPDDVARVVVKEMRAAYANPDALAAQGALEALAKRIERSAPRRGRQSCARGWSRRSPSPGSVCRPPWRARCARPTPSSR